MSRNPRVHIENALYLVTSRGDNNREIFKDKEDYQAYLDLLKKYKQQYGFKLFAFSLFPGHLHLLIELLEGVTISEIMHDLNSNYIKYFNSRHQREGHLFKERYSLILAQKEPYLLQLTAYVHLKPVLEKIAAEAKDYSYSSLSFYSASCDTQGFDARQEIRDISVSLPAGTSYEAYLKNVTPQAMERFADELNRKKILGDSSFLEKVQAKAAEIQKSASLAPFSFRKYILAGSIVIFILGIFAMYSFTKNMKLRNNLAALQTQKAQRDKELEKKIEEEKEFVKRDMAEKYAADSVSYQVMAIRLEKEKEKARELEARLSEKRPDIKVKGTRTPVS